MVWHPSLQYTLSPFPNRWWEPRTILQQYIWILIGLMMQLQDKFLLWYFIFCLLVIVSDSNIWKHNVSPTVLIYHSVLWPPYQLHTNCWKYFVCAQYVKCDLPFYSVAHIAAYFKMCILIWYWMKVATPTPSNWFTYIHKL